MEMKRQTFKKVCSCDCLPSNVSSDSNQSTQDQNEPIKIVNKKRTFLSEPTFMTIDGKQLRKTISEPNIHYALDYSDYEQSTVEFVPKLATWELLSSDDMDFVRTYMFDENSIKSLIASKLSNDELLGERQTVIFSSIAWDIFKYMRNNQFNGVGIWSMLGLLYLTHRFFLSASSRSALDIYKFFIEGMELHTILKPPESNQIFNHHQFMELAELFETSYLMKLPGLNLATCDSDHEFQPEDMFNINIQHEHI